MKCDRCRSTLGKIVLPGDCPALCSRTFHSNPREEAQRDAAGMALWCALYFRKSDVKCNRSQFLNTFCESCSQFLMVSPVPKHCWKWLERCEAHQQLDGRDRWFTVQKMPQRNFRCQTCRVWLSVVCPNWSNQRTSWSCGGQCCLVYSGWLMEGVPWAVLENLISKDSLALNGQRM